MRALLVVNPKATATTPGMRDVLAYALSSETKLDVVQTEARGHATSLARQAVVEGLDVVVALGGDGTVNEVVNGLLADGPSAGLPALGVVPGGNANVFARALGLPETAIEATGHLLGSLRHGRRRTVGLATAGDRWFTFCAGLGLDAEVVRRVEGRRRDGRKATPGLFVRQGVQHFFLGAQRKEPAMTVQVGDRAPERIGLALVCNTTPWTYLGPRPVQPCPEASFDTGLDLFALRRLGTLSTLNHLRQILARDPRPRGRDLLRLHDEPEFVLRADRPLAFQVDGDDLGDRSEVVFRSVPRALDVVL
ncbi:MAG: Transcription regulator [contains diacylglycerol kinase catalytic domain] [uncultured Frankineae bacterium]|uniref:Transcription regulator [contains diacylglycerol kinase catalytic domain] n=1 Tax=uncultured Frankineae bacterium TaxID=437475 RepID=A0A6J4KPX9_9ACTN|nr:MAG: Transcription regulator [contains diacylglycerol kinase catalytic domain] [uncultured Frankineae bacterium]